MVRSCAECKQQEDPSSMGGRREQRTNRDCDERAAEQVDGAPVEKVVGSAISLFIMLYRFRAPPDVLVRHFILRFDRFYAEFSKAILRV